jgi:hypothetical protein
VVMRSISALLLLTTPCLAQSGVFQDDAALLATLRAASPAEATCAPGGAYRGLYEQEVGFCTYRSDVSSYRVSVTPRAVLVDIAPVKPPQPDPEALKAQLAKFTTARDTQLERMRDLLARYGFSVSEAQTCVRKAQRRRFLELGARNNTYELRCLDSLVVIEKHDS